MTDAQAGLYTIVSERGVWRVARLLDGAWAGHDTGPMCYSTPVVSEWLDYGSAAAHLHDLATGHQRTCTVIWIKPGDEHGSDLGVQPPHTDGPL